MKGNKKLRECEKEGRRNRGMRYAAEDHPSEGINLAEKLKIDEKTFGIFKIFIIVDTNDDWVGTSAEILK